MASLRRLSNSPYWIACFTLPNGTRTQRSTKTTNRREAQRIADKFEDAAKIARKGKLVESQARKVIADIYAISNNDELPSSKLKEFFDSFLKRKELEAGDKTHIRYGVALEQFLSFLGPKQNSDVSHVCQRSNQTDPPRGRFKLTHPWRQWFSVFVVLFSSVVLKIGLRSEG